MSSPTTPKSVQLLADALSGHVLVPGDPGYDEARRIHNGLIDKHPAVIARCLHTADVAATRSLSAGAKGSRSRSAAVATTSPAGRSPRAG